MERIELGEENSTRVRRRANVVFPTQLVPITTTRAISLMLSKCFGI
jgi:hypothetical protein